MAKIGPGELVGGKYRIERVVDPGPPTATCLAVRQSDGVPVALKVLQSVLASNREHLGRFQREAEIFRRLKHPAVPSIIEWKSEGAEHFLALEVSRGESLASRLEKRGALPVKEAIGHCEWLLDVLTLLHESEVVHRDLAPKNLVFARLANGREILRIVDFRAAHLGGEAARKVALTTLGAGVGTPEFQAPEQIAGGKIDGRVDLYALGCLAYTMILGHPPFTGAAHEVMAKQVKDEPVSPRASRPELQISTAVDNWILRLLRKRPEERFSDARIARQALHSAQAQVGSTMLPPSPMTIDRETIALEEPIASLPALELANPSPASLRAADAAAKAQPAATPQPAATAPRRPAAPRPAASTVAPAKRAHGSTAVRATAAPIARARPRIPRWAAIVAGALLLSLGLLAWRALR